MPEEYRMFSTGISAQKGQVSIIVNRTFLDLFDRVDWAVIVEGRVARMTLDGPKVKLCLHAVYLDPESLENKFNAIRDLNKAMDPSAHNIVAGDFDFVEHPSDRIAKASANVATSEDCRAAEQWKRHMSHHKLQEFEQEHFTCEHSHGWSRIDRIYTDLHAANLLCSSSFCTFLTHPRLLSDHSPI